MQPGPDLNPYAAPSAQADRDFGGFGTNASSGPFATGLVWAALGGAGAVLLAIYRAVLISRDGQSLAKKILKTKIVRLDGSLPGFVHGVVLRAWVVPALGAIPVLGNLIGIVDAVLIFREDRRTLHDHIAGTNVIQVQ